MDYKVKHLEMIQAVITRLAGNSFQSKQWALTLLGVIWGIALKNDSVSLNYGFWMTNTLIIMFWHLSSYYLQQEKLFRLMYDEALMNTNNTSARLVLTPSSELRKKKPCIVCVMFSRTQLGLYGVLLLLNIVLHYSLS